MQRAWYEYGAYEPISDITGLTNVFQIKVDSDCKAINFVSCNEQYCRERSMQLDTTDLQWMEGWDMLTVNEKLQMRDKERADYKQEADSVHLANNRGQQQVWIINNSDDTVTIPVQDWSYICILQGRAKDGLWYPVQYWNFSTCGNSYSDKHFPPKTANSFVTTIPREGDFATKLRYKLLGKNNFYYSNEFDGKIDRCQFVEDSSSYRRYGIKRLPHYKLDSIIHLMIL